jgi:membrane protease YdiL (CAAX protease family)
MEPQYRRRNSPLTIALAAVLGLAIAALGLLPWMILARLNERWWPNVPWCAPIGLLWLFFFWSYLNGAGWPVSTSQTRHRLLRAVPLHGRRLRWCLFTGVIALIALVTLDFVAIQFVELEPKAFRPKNLAALSLGVLVGAVLMSAVVAGVVEEAAYRGYMQGILQRRFRAPVAIAIMTIVFTGVHLFGGPKTFPLALPVCAASIVFGTLTTITRSLLPAILVHVLADIATLPVEWGLIGYLPVGRFYSHGVDVPFAGSVTVLLVAWAATIAALLKLAGAGDSKPSDQSATFVSAS